MAPTHPGSEGTVALWALDPCLIGIHRPGLRPLFLHPIDSFFGFLLTLIDVCLAVADAAAVIRYVIVKSLHISNSSSLFLMFAVISVMYNRPWKTFDEVVKHLVDSEQIPLVPVGL